MDAHTLADDVRDDLETELSRLGSSKWLYALTDGEMTGDAVRTAAAADAAAVAERFEAWTDDGAPFDALADAAADRHATADADAAPATSPVYDALDDADDAVERLGAALGYVLVLDRTVGQMVGFFVGDADPTTANTFREIRDGVDADREAVLDALDDACDDEAEWDRARTAATAVVEAAYADYVDTLESMGVQPKNVC
jgi:hypothetical protein